MSELLAYPLFSWIGLILTGAAIAVLVKVALLVVVVSAWSIIPDFHCRRPINDMVFRSYRRDIRTGEGERLPVAPGIKIARWFGLSWKRRWWFGFMLFCPDEKK